MTGEPITVRTEHPAEWIAALPVLVGYELTDRATLTFTGHIGQLICVAAVPHAASTAQITAILTAQADSIRREGVQATWTTVHGLDPTNAWVRSQILADAAASAGLPRPHPNDQFAVDGTHAWPVTGIRHHLRDRLGPHRPPGGPRPARTAPGHPRQQPRRRRLRPGRHRQPAAGGHRREPAHSRRRSHRDR